MKRPGSRLFFVHHRLWQQDATYRAAILLGPPPLLAGLAALLVWFGLQTMRSNQDVPAAAHSSAPWARVPTSASTQGDTLQAEKPIWPMPAMHPDGSLLGFVPGWQGTIYPISVGPTLDPVMGQAAGRYTTEGAHVDFEAIMAAAGPLQGRYAGLQAGILAIRTAGRYDLSLQLDRSSPKPADCLVRQSFGHSRVISDVVTDLGGSVSQTFKPEAFDLQVGLYFMLTAFGCWHGDEAVGPGRMTVLIRHPGEDSLRPAKESDFFRPITALPGSPMAPR